MHVNRKTINKYNTFKIVLDQYFPLLETDSHDYFFVIWYMSLLTIFWDNGGRYEIWDDNSFD